MGCVAVWREFAAVALSPPSGRFIVAMVTGGVARFSLDHRLQALMPSASRRRSRLAIGIAVGVRF